MELRRILVPIDFSEPAEAALRYAMDLAKVFGAEITVVHVTELAVRSVPDAALLSVASFGDVASVLRVRLQEHVQRCSGQGVTLHALSVEGVPYVEIVRIGNDHDLVVMSTHGRTGLAHFLLGSIAERVVRTSAVPVLTVRSAPPA